MADLDTEHQELTHRLGMMETTYDELVPTLKLVAETPIDLFVVWSYRSYRATELRGATSHRWSSGWAVGGWFIPFANLVLPKMVINEIDQMSAPELVPPIGDGWRSQPRLMISDWWWVTFVAGMLVLLYDRGTVTVSHRMFIPILGFVLCSVAGVLGAVTVAKIGRRLHR